MLPMGGTGAAALANTQIIALVADDPDLRDALQFAVRVAGFRAYALAGAGAAEALAMARPDCLVVDDQLALGDGLSLIGHVRAACGRIPAVLLASFPGPNLRRRAAQAGVDIVEKPMVDGALFERLRMLCISSLAKAAT